MTKLMFALWGPALSTPLHDPVLHAALARAGVERVQVNVDDEPVAAAMRIATAEPIGAIVSAWSEAPVAPVLDLLGAVGDRLAGWEVEERRPLHPPEAWDGSRADALANVAILRRPAELTQEEWLRRWLVDHTPIAMATQATFGYLQNVVKAPVVDGSPVVHALVEELFPSAGITDIHAFYGSGGDAGELDDRMGRLMASVARIGADHDLDLVPTSRYLYALDDT